MENKRNQQTPDQTTDRDTQQTEGIPTGNQQSTTTSGRDKTPGNQSQPQERQDDSQTPEGRKDTHTQTGTEGKQTGNFNERSEQDSRK